MDSKLQPITITLNGREVSGYPGMSILELAEEAGVKIPTLCHESRLSPVGACRLCIVEDEPTGRLMASCVTPIAAGMVINTDSPRVTEHRKTILKLILASHPDSCLVCDKGNRCELRKIAADMGIGLVELERIPKIAAIEEVNPFIVRDLSKCVLCARCVRACQELVVEGAIDYFRRGFNNKIATANDLPLENSECTFCGTCVALCPTGALMEKEKAYTGTAKTSVDTTCPYCGCGCSITAEVTDNRIVRVTPGNKGVNNGTLCVRGSYGYDFVYSPDRLSKPLVRTEEGFEETSWDAALEQVAAGLMRVKEKYGAGSLAVLGSPRCTNEENYLLQQFARRILGTNNIDNSGRLYNDAARPGPARDPGDIERSDVIIVIGADPASSAPIVEYAVKRAVKSKGAGLILIDPRRTNLAQFARLRLRTGAGTDTALLNSMAKVILDEKLADKNVLKRKTPDIKEFSGSLEKYTPEYAESVTGVPAADIKTAARLYAGAAKAAIVYGSGVTQQKDGAAAVKALRNMAILTGQPPESLYALQRDCNARGACDTGVLPGFLPGYSDITDDAARGKYESLWGASLPAEPGLTAVEIIEQAKAGKIRGLWIVGENPVAGFPDGRMVAEALASLDFLVVQDMFMTPTAGLAAVVLPAASFAEKEGTFTSFDGRINRLHKVIEPVNNSLPDWQIILRLAEKAGAGPAYASLKQVTEEIEKNVYEQPHSEELGLSAAGYRPDKKTRRNGREFTLLTGISLYHSGGGIRSSKAKRLREFSPEPYVEISAQDAVKLGISNGDRLKLISATGELIAAPVISSTLPEGVLYMLASFPDCPVNVLFDIDLDPETKVPSFKSRKVGAERIRNDGETGN